MARRPFDRTARDGNGNAIGSATVTLTLHSDGSALTCYAAESGGASLAGSTTTASNGTFRVWVSDDDYPLSTLIDVTISKSGYSVITGTFIA